MFFRRAATGSGRVAAAEISGEIAGSTGSRQSSGHSLFFAYLSIYGICGSLTLSFYPTYSFPTGDEATYYSYAQHPWTLVSDFFAGYRPKEVINPYNARLFLTPFAAVFQLFGFTVTGARLVVFAYGLLVLVLVYLSSAPASSKGSALVATVLLSLSSPFVYMSHGVRPESLMAVLIMLAVWLLVRSGGDVAPRDYFWLGMVSASCLWVHYNGVFFYVIVFVSAAIYEGGLPARGKWLNYLLAGGLFGVLYTALNLVPARSTIGEFGWVPVSFTSNNRLAVLDWTSWPKLIDQGMGYYLGYLAGGSYLERRTYAFSSLLMALASVGLFYRRGREDRLLASLMALIGLVMVVVLPNHRWHYTYYLWPLGFTLLGRTLAKLSAHRWGQWLAACVLLPVAVSYLVDDANALRRHYDFSVQHRRLEREIRRLIAALGEHDKVTVFGSQVFHAAAHDARFRTPHSLISTGDMEATLRATRPDMVLLHPLSVRTMGQYLAHDALYEPAARSGKTRPGEVERLVREGILVRDKKGKARINWDHVTRHIEQSLRHEGYYEHRGGPWTWNGTAVQIFLKRPVPHRVSGR